MQLDLTKEEVQALYEIIDLAVKAGGIQVAKIAVPITDKLIQTVKESSNDSE